MKKSIIAGLLITSALLTGCGGDSDFTGEKVGEVVNESGDKTIATVTFENGTPVDVDIDVETTNGMKSQLSEEGKYSMGNAGMLWHEQTEAVEEALVENNFDLTKITMNDDGTTDAISGVTVSVNDYLEAVQDALNQVN